MTLNSWSHSLLPLSAEITAHLASFRFSCENIEDIPLRQSAEPTWCNHPLSPPLQISTHQGQGFNTHSNIHSMPQSWLKASWPKGLRKTGKVQAGELTWLVTPRRLQVRGSEHWPSLNTATLTLQGDWPPDEIFHPKSFPHHKSPNLAAPWVQSFFSLGDWYPFLIKGNLLLGRLA